MSDDDVVESIVDDGNVADYKSRIAEWAAKRHALRVNLQQEATEESSPQPIDPLEESHAPHPVKADCDLGRGLKIPGDVYTRLFDHQKEGVRWLWNVHKRNHGGVLADEMGLGKTIQVISFLSGLLYSRQLGNKSILLICPATIMNQWVKEFHEWWAPFRISVFHACGMAFKHQKMTPREARKFLRNNNGCGCVVITSYDMAKKYQGDLIPFEWEYVVLDEGQKIRNPDTDITLAVKKLKSRHRILLSGTPVQNDYKELWAIMDFIAPGKFGTLPVFEEEFAKRIKTAGYVNASQLSVRIGYHCARRLAERIKPYMLRRTKEDVKSEFIPKSDEVLFCRLSEEQRLLYSQYLKKDVEMKRLLKIRRLPNERSGAHLHITRLTQICNHPDIYLSNLDRCLTENHGYVYGEAERSGKMIVVKALLAEWEKKGNKVLLFCRSARMLDILETFVSREGYNYRRLDGSTSMHIRDKRINDFNNNENIFVFLLTTQVGGVGLNLVGADRVIIYDPDWNPSTDDQATQRALRYGQTKPVSIYRLMTVGTIEEKIYHRQVFKRALARKVTRKPDFDDIQFEADELHDLFSLGGEDEELTDTRYMFEEAEIRKVRLPKSKKANSDNVSKRLTNGSSALSRESQDELIAVFDYSTNQIIHVRRSTQQEEDLHPPETSDKKEKDIGELLKKLPKIKKKIRSDDPVSGNADLPNGSSVVNNSDASKANGSSSLPNRRKRRRLELFKATEKPKTPTVNNVEGVARVEFRNHSDDEDNKGRDARRRGIDSSSEEEKEEGNDDNHIIQVLYETAGLHSAFNHQRVVRTRGKRSRMSMADIDAVAESVANDADHHLDENADFLARYGPGTLTFTGRNGEAGIPKKSSSSNTAWSLYKKGWNKR